MDDLTPLWNCGKQCLGDSLARSWKFGTARAGRVLIMVLMEILKEVAEGRISSPSHSDADLRAMIKECASQQRGQLGIEATHAIFMIRDELVRREGDRAAGLATERHQEALAQDRILHRKTQFVAWIAVVVSAIGILVGLGSCAKDTPRTNPPGAR